MVSQSLGACARPFLPGFQDDHFAWFIFNLTFSVMREHALLERVRCGFNILASFILDHCKGAKPHLGINTD
jgi:hypothetical protein